MDKIFFEIQIHFDHFAEEQYRLHSPENFKLRTNIFFKFKLKTERVNKTGKTISVGYQARLN